MSKVKTKEIIICLVAIMFLMLTIVTDVFAIDDINEVLGENNTNGFEDITDEGTEDEEEIEDEEIDNIVDEPVDNTSENLVNNTTSNNTVETIPDTGLDYSVVFVIAICGISAIYAYKKIRDYNNF